MSLVDHWEVNMSHNFVQEIKLFEKLQVTKYYGKWYHQSHWVHFLKDVKPCKLLVGA